MPKILQFSLDYNYSESSFEKEISKRVANFSDYRILSKSLDARGANSGKKPRFHLSVEVIQQGENFNVYSEDYSNLLDQYKNKHADHFPIIIGAGPAGLFCALRLLEYGIPSIIFERGSKATERMKFIARFWRYGEFNEEDNVCYGEGGAGLFSDGKLITRVKSPFVGYVMKRLVDFGAPEETAYTSNPHLGSNKIRNLITVLTNYLTSKGCIIHYNTKVDKLLFDTNDASKVIGVETSHRKQFHSPHVVLAVGHSAREMFEHLKKNKVSMEAKDFAVGVRIEHPRSEIDRFQYGNFVSEELSSARYRLSHHNRNSHRGSYSFCMCPGGYVLSSGTKADGIVVNGMSNFRRNSPWSNSAIVVSVKKDEDFDTQDVLSGFEFQQSIERKAFEYSKEHATGKEIPSQLAINFMDGVKSKNLPKTSCPSKIFSHQLNTILPTFVAEHLQEALLSFDKKMKGFLSNNALLLAPETRTSSPVTISREKDTLLSCSHSGLYPCGEGAGYAGGITSAAVDGVNVAESIIQDLC